MKAACSAVNYKKLCLWRFVICFYVNAILQKYKKKNLYIIYRGVQCYDTIAGAQCGPCPSGYLGDGRTCTMKNHCDDNPCASGNLY